MRDISLRRNATYDSVHMGRSCIDLYSNDSGAPFAEIRSFNAYVGGSPTNKSVGLQRLGKKTALLTAIGADKVGEFVMKFLNDEGVETRFIPTKPGRRTSAVLLGIQPPDTFPLVYYRDNCADIELTIDDVMAAPVDDCRVFEFVGTNLSREPSRSATIFAAERAKRAGALVVFDVDFRPDQWHDPRSFGIAVSGALHAVDIVIGTQDELNAIMLTDVAQMKLEQSAVSDTKVAGRTEDAVEKIFGLGTPRSALRGAQVVIEKTGSRGCRIHRIAQSAGRASAPAGSSESRIGSTVEVPGFPVEIVNVLGAGDAFGAGFIAGLLSGYSLEKAGRLGNACGAIVVTRHACSASMPYWKEVNEFADARGGL